MTQTIAASVCETCRYATKQHQRYYTYDNRMLDTYTYYCLKEDLSLKPYQFPETCEEWKDKRQP